MIGKVKESEAVDAATEKAQAVLDLGVERAKELISEHTPHSPTGNGNLTVH
jgi:hypothetical protein